MNLRGGRFLKMGIGPEFISDGAFTMLVPEYFRRDQAVSSIATDRCR